MIHNVSRIKLNRLVIVKDTKRIYDQLFHEGINIIRGEHSVGKSTILDLIFYVLGGELKKDDWKKPADLCSTVNAEVLINEHIICLSRAIDPSGAVPHIRVYEGTYDKAMQDTLGWIDYGPRRGKDRQSFSEIIFELLNWGQFKSDDYSNLTMHQILRLIYLSQSSDSNRIFRKESNRSDNENTRIAIAEFLFGLDDLETHSYRQNLLRLERIYESTGSELRTYFSILGDDADLTVDKIKDEISEIRSELNDIDDDRKILLDSNGDVYGDDKNTLSEERRNLFTEIQELTFNINDANKKSDLLKNEIQDCLFFGKSIQFRIKSLTESQEAYKALGQVSFEYCPCCFSQIEVAEENDGGCILCKSKKTIDSLEGKYIENLNELQYQKRQNDNIIEEISEKIEKLDTYLKLKEQRLELCQNRLFEISLVSNSREMALSNIIEGRTERLIKIGNLEDKIKSISKVDELKKQREEVSQSITNLQGNIAALEEKNKIRRDYVYKSLSDIATSMLEKDTQNEENFQIATILNSEIDFSKDRWLLDERVNYSDSSNVVKKASLHLSFLIFSLKDSTCRYPRFSIMDFECGDINEARSHNLQKLIVSSLKGFSNYQLIMTTSKVDDSLNNDAYGVGRYYNKNDYILKV